MPWQLSASAETVPRVRIYLDDARLSLCLRPLQPAHSAGSLDTISCAHKATAEQGEATRLALSLALTQPRRPGSQGGALRRPAAFSRLFAHFAPASRRASTPSRSRG